MLCMYLKKVTIKLKYLKQQNNQIRALGRRKSKIEIKNKCLVSLLKMKKAKF